MKLFTVQPREVYDLLRENGVFTCDYSKSQNREPCFHRAYDWLVEQMAQRIGKPDGVSYPIWAWYIFDWKNEPPELADWAVTCKDPVLMELEVPDEEVVLSDFDAWHSVLNLSYLDKSTSEEAYDAECEAFEKLSPSERDRAMLESWQLIFDVAPMHSDWVDRGRFVQATFWELRPENVVSVKDIV